ncbi:MAG: DUF2851 family protein [Bacteroidetes bacterium]|nr:DUF2851 family protein [Bacteroidota bacterium]
MLQIKEDLLQYIWQYQRFNNKNLYSNNKKTISIIYPGNLNTSAGPDFINSKISLDGIILHGHIEIHINSSDWYKHKHEKDNRYNNVILHVVWNDDILLTKRKDNTHIPTIELKHKISNRLLKSYKRLKDSQSDIPCSKYINSIENINKLSMLEKAMFQRLNNKNNLVNQLLLQNNGDWEETAFQLLAHTFGFKINSNNLLELSKSINYKILKKHATKLIELECLLLGQANLLPEENFDEYVLDLKKNYKFFKIKYNLKPSKIVYEQWKFFRLRPANFPTIRISQLASLIHKNKNIFNLLVNSSKYEIYNLFNLTQSEYWTEHYTFLKKSKTKISGLGNSSIENIMINAIVPLLVSYGKFKEDHLYVDKALQILQSIPPEKNNILDKWKRLNIKIENAFDSQAYIELYNNFCSKKKCLSCNIGCIILGRSDKFEDLLDASLNNKNIKNE